MNATGAGVPKRSARAEAQRRRILAAAQSCFVDHGFHAASMASIAAAAGISAGLIYRYFPGKDAIVLAIIERQLAERRAKIAELHASADFAAGVVATFKQWRANSPNCMSVALFLAMSADAGRDPQVARALRESDRLSRADFVAWLCRSRVEGGQGLAADVAESRAILIQCIVEGLAVRAAREPDLDIDAVAPSLRAGLDRLMKP